MPQALRSSMTDLLIFDFINDTPEEKTPRLSGETTGWETVIFELADDD